MKINKVEYLLFPLSIILLAVFVGGFFNSWKECSKNNGTLVRGVVWFQCVDKK